MEIEKAGLNHIDFNPAFISCNSKKSVLLFFNTFVNQYFFRWN